MIARVTLAEIDAVRHEHRPKRSSSSAPRCSLRSREQDGYEGCYVLTTPEGKALVFTFWRDEEAAEAGLEKRLLRRAGRQVRDVLPLAARP